MVMVVVINVLTRSNFIYDMLLKSIKYYDVIHLFTFLHISVFFFFRHYCSFLGLICGVFSR